jgi:O-antigen/teichoic acid export membrane protein
LLALLPLAFGIRFVLGSLLVAEGHTGARALLEALGAVVMIVAAAFLIPRFGAQGMVGMVMAAEVTVVVAATIALVTLRPRPINPGDLDVSVLPE